MSVFSFHVHHLPWVYLWFCPAGFLTTVLLFPPGATLKWLPKPLQRDLWAFCCICWLLIVLRWYIVMPDIWLLLVYVLYVLCPWKAVQRCAACLYPNDRNANFCQVCGASTGTSVPSISQPDLDMTAVNNHFVELGPCPVENPIRDRSPPWSNNWLVSSPPLPPWSPYLQVHPRILLNFLLVEIGQAEQLFTHRHVIGNCVSAPADWQPVLLTPSLGSYTLFIIGRAASILQTLSRIPWWKNIWNLPGKSRQVQR